MSSPALARLTLARILLALALAAAGLSPAGAIEIGDPNLSRDAAQCGELSAQFKRAVAGHAEEPRLADARKEGARGAYLCRFERYREGIALLERALADLREAGGDR